MIAISRFKLIALDLDGTTLCRGTVADSTREWLMKARTAGVEFTIATGRHWTGMVSHLVDELGIQIPVVTSNGAEVRTARGQLLARRGIAAQEIEFLYQQALRKGAHFWGATVDGPIEEHDVQHHLTAEWLKFGFHSTDEGIIKTLWEELKGRKEFTLTNSHPLNIEVNAAGVDKASGLERVCKECGIDQHELVAIGDSLNDVSMLSFAGLGIAMGNAQESVKEIADTVTLSCDEDGVGHAIAVHVLGEVSKDGRHS